MDDKTLEYWIIIERDTGEVIVTSFKYGDDIVVDGPFASRNEAKEVVCHMEIIKAND